MGDLLGGALLPSTLIMFSGAASVTLVNGIAAIFNWLEGAAFRHGLPSPTPSSSTDRPCLQLTTKRVKTPTHDLVQTPGEDLHTAPHGPEPPVSTGGCAPHRNVAVTPYRWSAAPGDLLRNAEFNFFRGGRRDTGANTRLWWWRRRLPFQPALVAHRSSSARHYSALVGLKRSTTAKPPHVVLPLKGQ